MEVLDKYLIVIFTAAVVSTDVTVSQNEYNTILVPLNYSSSFSCLMKDILNCSNWTVNDISTNRVHYQTCFSNTFIFQSGTHNVMDQVENRQLSLAAKNDLIIQGQDNVIIKCINGSSVTIKTAIYITISDIHFLDCDCNIITSREKNVHVVIKFTNLKFSNSSLILNKRTNKGGNKVKQDLHIHVAIKGQSSSNVSVTCLNSNLLINTLPQGTLTLSDMQIQNCSNIKLYSKTKNASIQIFQTRFTNSCLEYKADLTNSDSHSAQLNIKKAKFEWCYCGPIRVFSKREINTSIILD